MSLDFMEVGAVDSQLASFIERHTETIIEHAIEFSRSLEVSPVLEATVLRDHLPEILIAIVADLRTPQTRAEEVEKSEGRESRPQGQSRSAAGTHALHRAHSGYSISELVSEYRALRASVLRLWTDTHDANPIPPGDVTRFNEAVDEAIAESVSYYAEEADRWRHIFLGILGHDLRNPLNAILLTSELIAQQAVDVPTVDAAQRLVRAGTHMRELLDKLLVYNRTQLGAGFNVEKADVDLVRICSDEIELLKMSMPAACIRFTAPASLHALCDAGRMREALANLVVNAHKYGIRGGEIRVELLATGSGADLAVSNAGDSIPPDTLIQIFDPLKRSQVSDGESERVSLGLGLFVVKQIALSHGGSIDAESTDGTTTFRIRLPRT